MHAVALLKLSSDFAFEELLETVTEIAEPRSWATLQPLTGEYLHTGGSIVSIVQHIACCKLLYASRAFTNGELRGRHALERTRAIGHDWQKTQDFLRDSQTYWMESWTNLTDAELDEQRGTIWEKTWPAWKIINRMTLHDQYHLGQINLMRSIVPPAATPPDMQFDEEEKHLRNTPLW